MKKNTVLKAAGMGVGLLLACIAMLAILVHMHILPSPRELLRPGPPQDDLVIDHSVREQVLNRLLGSLHTGYIFPDKVTPIETALRSKQQRGEYDAIDSAEAFAATLTDDLQGASGDLHLHVGYSEASIPEPAPGADSDAPTPAELEEMIRRNYGFEVVQRLGFNIGYVNLTAFSDANLVVTRLGAVMTLLSETRDLIIDLRENHGGDPKTVELLASYLFDQPTRLNDIYWRADDRTEQSWTHDELEGPKYGDQRKVYVLISEDTFSAGEDFAFALKNLKRATLIGEPTAGGAHPGEMIRLHDHFVAFVPSGRSISPVTQTNWEGVGVLPDVVMNADDALDHAQYLVIKDRLTTEKDEFRRGRLLHGLTDFD